MLLCQKCFYDVIYICFNKTLFKKGFSNVSKMAHFDIIITLKNIFMTF